MTQDIAPVYLHPHNAANEPVTLHRGSVGLHKGDATWTGKGRLELRFLPSTGLRLALNIESGHAPDPGAEVQAEVAGGVADALVNAVRHSFQQGRTTASVEAGVSRLQTGAPDNLASLGFQVLNFPDFLTPGPKTAPVFGFPPMVADLEAGGWRVRLTAVEESSDVFKSLKETGGFAFTHLGVLERADGAAFNVPEANALLDMLAVFLSFARGAACSLPVRWGTDTAGAITWQCWG